MAYQTDHGSQQKRASIFDKRGREELNGGEAWCEQTLSYPILPYNSAPNCLKVFTPILVGCGSNTKMLTFT